MWIGGHDLSQDVLIVAEAGNNHEGRFELAQELVHQAAACGAGAVKFQTFRTEHFVGTGDLARFERLKRFELQPAQFGALADLAHGLGLLFISTPLDLQSVEVLEPLVDAYKIASGDNTFYPLIDAVAGKGKPVVISTGLSDLAVIDRAVSRVQAASERAGRSTDLAILHCVSAYPAPIGEVNLLAIDVLAARYACTIGYSDHTIGLDAAVAAAARGARIIEKHFTLDKHYSAFRDHQLSADPADLRELVARVRDTVASLGSPEKRVQPSEQPAVTATRRSIVAGGPLRAGHVLEWADLTWTRPAGGLAPGEEARLLGHALVRDVAFGERLTPADVERVI